LIQAEFFMQFAQAAMTGVSPASATPTGKAH